MRLVYEIESRVRNLRNANDENEREEQNRRRQKSHDQTQEQNQNSEPDRHQNGEYSPERNFQLLASLDESKQCLATNTVTLVSRRREI
jgi:hypothetical protein